jgi:hypothetical protein
MDDMDMSILIQDELAVVNGENLRLKRRAQQRLNELRDIFAMATIRGLLLRRDMHDGHWMEFLRELNTAAKNNGNMEHVSIPTIEIHHGAPQRNILQAIMNVNKAMYVAHVYIRGLVKTQNMHKQVQERQDADIPTGVVKRIMQSISELVSDEDFTILGLLPLRLVPPDVSTHSFNTAIYTMVLCDRLGLIPQITSLVSMAVIYQDLDRLVGISVAQREASKGVDMQRQYNSNLRDVARMLGRVGGDKVSTIRILATYERGLPFEKPISRPFYRGKRLLHIATRIIDIARTYDLMIQGLEGHRKRTPDLAVQHLQSRAGELYDPALVELFTSTMGVYPIGTTVELTSGEKCVVIKTPDVTSDPRRPVLRLLNPNNPMIMDLADPRFRHIDIARTFDMDESEVPVSKIFLLS